MLGFAVAEDIPEVDVVTQNLRLGDDHRNRNSRTLGRIGIQGLGSFQIKGIAITAVHEAIGGHVQGIIHRFHRDFLVNSFHIQILGQLQGGHIGAQRECVLRAQGDGVVAGSQDFVVNSVRIQLKFGNALCQYQLLSRCFGITGGSRKVRLASGKLPGRLLKLCIPSGSIGLKGFPDAGIVQLQVGKKGQILLRCSLFPAVGVCVAHRFADIYRGVQRAGRKGNFLLGQLNGQRIGIKAFLQGCAQRFLRLTGGHSAHIHAADGDPVKDPASVGVCKEQNTDAAGDEQCQFQQCA